MNTVQGSQLHFVLRSADYYPLLFSMDMCPALRELLSCGNPAIRAKACNASQLQHNERRVQGVGQKDAKGLYIARA